MQRRRTRLHRLQLGGALALALLLFAAEASAKTCVIFVHGRINECRRGNDWSCYEGSTPQRDQSAMVEGEYWVSEGLGSDFIRTVTANGRHDKFVVSYDGDDPWATSAWDVVDQVIAATNGQADGNRNRCTSSWASGNRDFYVVAHSQGAMVMDFILGNTHTYDPIYDRRFRTVGDRITEVFTVGGAHRGTRLADAACGSHSRRLCNFAGAISNGLNFTECDSGTVYGQTSDVFQVKSWANSPRKRVNLIGGYGTIDDFRGLAAALCLQDVNDGVLAYASQFACAGDPNATYDEWNLCERKQESRNFVTLDTADENHDQQRNGEESRAARRRVRGGVDTSTRWWQPWKWPGTVRARKSSAALIRDSID